jgi:hypothetical protein
VILYRNPFIGDEVEVLTTKVTSTYVAGQPATFGD